MLFAETDVFSPIHQIRYALYNKGLLDSDEDGTFLFRIKFKDGSELKVEVQYQGSQTIKVFRGMEFISEIGDSILLTSSLEQNLLNEITTKIAANLGNVESVIKDDINDLAFVY